MNHKRIFIFAILLVFSLSLGTLIFAQEAAPLTLTGIDPQRIPSGQAGNVTLTGIGFNETTSAELGGVGQVASSVVSDTAITISLPAELQAGSYGVSVSNADGSSASLPVTLIVDEQPTQIPLITVTHLDPSRITSGQQVTLSIFGSNFTSASVVRAVGMGLLETGYVNANALTAALPGTLAPGQYTIEVSDANGQAASLPNALRVDAPVPPTMTPLPPTQAPPPPTPIPVVSKPSLVLTNFSAQPATIEPGQVTRLSFTVSNVGMQVAQTIVVTLGTGSSFVPAGGQSSVALPPLGPGTAYNGQMQVAVGLDVDDGPARIPLALTYQDMTGERFTTNAELSVTVRNVETNSQIVVDAYTVEPSPAEPGQPVLVRMTIVNVGNKAASQVSVRFNGSDNVLLPNGHSDTFVVGDLEPGQRAPLQVSLIVNTEAEDGPQVQPIVISYLEDNETKETNTRMTVTIAEVNQPEPLLLLAEYTIGEDVLQPGMRFTLDATLRNAGSADARTTMVTFGTVQSSGDNGGGNPNNPDNNNGDSNTNATPSTTFAPLGTAGVVYIGDVVANDTANISQEFLITGSVSSGIYNLPITLQYVLTDGTVRQNALSVSLVVIAPPRLEISLPAPMPETVNLGEPAPLLLELVNNARTDLNLTGATVTATNAEVVEGAEIRLERLKTDEDANISAAVVPVEDGSVEITVTINYLNDLNQPASIVQTYTVEAVAPPPPVEEPIVPGPIVEELEPETDWFGEVLMALLGLGS